MKPYVNKFELTSPEICNDELQSWFNRNPGNIEQTFKVLKGIEQLIIFIIHPLYYFEIYM